MSAEFASLPEIIVAADSAIVLAQAVTATTPNLQPVDFSFIGLFAQADFMVKVVMLILLGCSGWSWTTIFWKEFQFRRIQKDLQKFETLFWSGINFHELKKRLEEDRPHAGGRVFLKGLNELSSLRGNSAAVADRFLDRMERVMEGGVDSEMRTMRESLTYLATVGSVAPFVGLFGTVWGIMNSFQSIAVAQRSTLAVVAPGIAEALFATALGLIAAIPAVVAYNRYVAVTAGIEQNLLKIIDDFSVILLRQFDRRTSPDEDTPS